MQRTRWMITLAAGMAMAAALAIVPIGWGQSEPTTEPAPPEPEEMMTQALDAILAGSYEQAYEQLRQVAAEPLRDSKEAFDSFAVQTQKVFELWGSPTDYELAQRQSAGSHLVRLHYIVRCPKHPIRWHGTFYRPADRWELINIAFSEDLDPMFAD